MPGPGTTFRSNALFYWLFEKKSHALHGEYVNPAPYSCQLEQRLGATVDGGLSFDGSRSLSELFLSLEIPASGAPVIKVDSSINKFWSGG